MHDTWKSMTALVLAACLAGGTALAHPHDRPATAHPGETPAGAAATASPDDPATRYELAAAAARVAHATGTSEPLSVRISDRLREAILRIRDLRRRLEAIEHQQHELRNDVDELEERDRD